MKLILSVTLMVLPILSFSQNLFYVSAEAEVFADGNEFIYLSNTDLINDGLLIVDDAIYFTGDADDEYSITNNNEFRFSRMVFQGNNEFQTSGEFSGTLQLEESANLHLNDGFIDINTIQGETNIRTITGEPGTYLQKEENAGTNSNFGNIGVELLSSDEALGSTSVYRRYTSIPVGVDHVESILRYFEVNPAVNENLNATTRFYFYDIDLNGYDISSLILFRREDGATVWTKEGGILTETIDFNYLEKSAIEAFSTWAIAADNVVVPVELVFFEAEAVDNEIVFTSWQTASEINNSHFEVERSQNGSDFETIGRVEGEGTTTQTQNYDLTDEQPYEGTSYYRLKQVDIGGQYEYSDIQQVYIEIETGIVLFPNPAEEFVNIRIPQTVDFDSFAIYNGQGKLVHQEDALDGHLQIDIAELASGMYIFELLSKSKSIKQIKFIKQ